MRIGNDIERTEIDYMKDVIYCNLYGESIQLCPLNNYCKFYSRCNFIIMILIKNGDGKSF